MTIDPEVISSTTKKARRASRNLPKWMVYSTGGIGVLMCVCLIKTLLPAIGLAFLLAFILSKSTNNRGY